MSRDPERAARQFFGGRVCLDFGNTLDWRTTDDPVEIIPSYAAFLSWSVGRGTITKPIAAKLERLAAQPGLPERVMASAYALRAEIWQVAENLRTHAAPDLNHINEMLDQSPAPARLIYGEGKCLHDFPGSDLREPLWPVLWSLMALLTSIDATRLGICQATGCGWFFVDESPNHTRLWCSSDVCGNRERVRRSALKRRVAERR
jgi:predicted RNA-binding Zn ribbon-like protein